MAELVEVKTMQGLLRGCKVTSKSGKTYYSFKGIPYAKPPLGDLRFKVAEPPEPWTGVREALVEGGICCQYDEEKDRFLGTEDCLYLNIYTPKLAEEQPALKPVMVWIHGGGFTSGSSGSDVYGPDYITDADVLLVTINYRLGVLGFLCVEHPAAAGNMGLKDQVSALIWVNQNISKFGGDPEAVTLFGESAGGAAVHLQTLSPMSKGLFHRAIAQSAVAVCPWTLEQRPCETAFRLGAILGCTTDDPQELVDFLRTVHIEKLVITASTKALSDKDKKRLVAFPFVPTIETDVNDIETFLPDHPKNLLENGCYHKIPFITGSNSREAIFMIVLCDLAKTEVLRKLDKNFADIVFPDLRFPEDYDKRVEVCNYIRKFFVRDEITIKEAIDLYSDLLFNEGISFTVKKMEEHNLCPVYRYRFAYDGCLNMLKVLTKLEEPGVSHADDIGYLFRVASMDLDLPPTSMDIKTRERMITLWTNFAKTGNPTPDSDSHLGVVWQPSTSANPCYLDINENLRLKESPGDMNDQFWETLYLEAGV